MPHIDRRDWMKLVAGGALAVEGTNGAFNVLKPDVPPDYVKRPEDYYEIVPWTFWDTLSIKAGQMLSHEEFAWSLFSRNPASYAKTRSDTNMMVAGMLMAPQQMRVDRIYFAHSPANDSLDIAKWSHSMSWSFGVGQKTFAERPFVDTYRVGEIGKFITSEYAPAGHVSDGDNGVFYIPPARVGGGSNRLPFVIDHDTRFFMGLHGEFIPSCDFKIVGMFDGILARGIC